MSLVWVFSSSSDFIQWDKLAVPFQKTSSARNQNLGWKPHLSLSPTSQVCSLGFPKPHWGRRVNSGTLFCAGKGRTDSTDLQREGSCSHFFSWSWANPTQQILCKENSLQEQTFLSRRQVMCSSFLCCTKPPQKPWKTVNNDGAVTDLSLNRGLNPGLSGIPCWLCPHSLTCAFYCHSRFTLQGACCCQMGQVSSSSWHPPTPHVGLLPSCMGGLYLPVPGRALFHYCPWGTF